MGSTQSQNNNVFFLGGVEGGYILCLCLVLIIHSFLQNGSESSTFQKSDFSFASSRTQAHTHTHGIKQHKRPWDNTPRDNTPRGTVHIDLKLNGTLSFSASLIELITHHNERVFLWSRFNVVQCFLMYLCLRLRHFRALASILPIARPTSSEVDNAFYFHFDTKVRTQKFRDSSQGVSTPDRYVFRSPSWGFFAKNCKQFSSSKKHRVCTLRVT